MYDVGLIDLISKALNPLLSLIMPTLNDEKAKKYISTNIAANMFGLGFAATPAGLNGIKRLQEISPEADKTVASDDMVTFLILNTAGVTLIPTTVIAIRQSYGAANPTDFMIYGIIGTVCSCVAGLVLDRIFRKKNNKWFLINIEKTKINYLEQAKLFIESLKKFNNYLDKDLLNLLIDRILIGKDFIYGENNRTHYKVTVKIIFAINNDNCLEGFVKCVRSVQTR